MRGRGLSKTIFGGVDFVKVINLDCDSFELNNNYCFTKDECDRISGRGVLVCYSGDLNDILSRYGEEPLWYTMNDGVLLRFILPCGVAALKLTDVIKFDEVKCNNWANEFNNGIDLIHIRREFDRLADPNLFQDTLLPIEAYTSLKTLFHGGVMNSKSGVFKNVHSYDLVSAHASNIVNELYPTGKFIRTYMNLDQLRCCKKAKDIFFLGNITLKNLRLKPNFLGIIYITPEAAMSASNVTISDTGYVISAESLRIPITDIYLECIDMCYEYDGVEDEFLFMCTESNKLPNNLRSYVLDKYNVKKTMAKNTHEYKSAKLLVNLCYGFLCRTTDDYEHYAYGHKLVWAYQFGVYTCLYTTLKIVKAMNEVVSKGGIPLVLATDSIKYIGDFELNSGEDLGDLKFEATYKRACIVSVYRAVYELEDGTRESKLAGCIKSAKDEYFNTHSPLDIFSDYIEIPNGKVYYEYNSETSRFEAVHYNYSLGRGDGLMI